MDSPQFDGQLFQLGCTNLNKGLAGYPGVVAEFVHPVPVGGVYTQLLHQLQADAAFPLAPQIIHTPLLAGLPIEVCQSPENSNRGIFMFSTSPGL